VLSEKKGGRNISARGAAGTEKVANRSRASPERQRAPRHATAGRSITPGRMNFQETERSLRASPVCRQSPLAERAAA